MKKTVIALLVVILLIAFVPLFALKDAEFGGSDDAGSQVVEEVDSSFQPIAEPILEKNTGPRASRRSGKSFVLCTGFHRSGHPGLLYGKICRKKEAGKRRMILCIRRKE